MGIPVENRYDFMLIFDVKDGNPNGDPDAGNLPRLDPETNQGLVTDVCLKRKVRNYVQLTKGLQPPFDIYVKEKAVLNNLIVDAFKQCGISVTQTESNAASEQNSSEVNSDASQGEKKPKSKKTKNRKSGEESETARKYLCQNYYDIRTFGAVLMTGLNAGQVRGPIQFTFARSVDPIIPMEHSITRCAVTKEEDKDKERTMGRKSTISYGLYIAYGFFSPALASQTGFNSDDLQLLWEALANMFDHDHSAARGMMSTCKLILFKHASALGNAQSGRLFELVDVKRNDYNKPVRSFNDYTVSIDTKNLPQGVEIIELV